MPRILLILLGLTMSFFYLAGCSSNATNPMTPSNTQNQNNLPIIDTSEGESSRAFLGMWNVEFDTESLTATVTPKRDLNAHMNITPYVSPVITVNNYDPLGNIVDVDVYNETRYSFW